MAVNPNFTNANANTPYASGTGSNTNIFPNGVTISGTIVKGNPTNEYPGVLTIGDAAVLTSPLAASQFLFGENTYGVGGYGVSIWQNQGLDITGKNTGVVYFNVIQFNSQVGNDTNDTVSYKRVSTIATAVGTAGQNYEINMVGLASTLKSVYPSIVQ